jgi:ABC-type nitrate/sulfonate/bicarbonate transport system substrate-binding protein
MTRVRALRSIVLSAVLITGLGLIVACGGGAEPTDGGRAPSQERGSIAIGAQLGTLATYAAQLGDPLGFYEEENLDVKVITANSTSNGLQGVLSGSINFYFGGPEALSANAEDPRSDLKIVAATGNSSAFALVSRPEITRVEDLKGKLFGVSALGSISTVTAQEAFAAHGLAAADVEPVVVGGSATRWSALQAGTIDVTTMSEPLVTAARDAGFTILGYTDLDLGAPQMVTGTITGKASWMEANRDITLRFLRAYMRTVAALYDEGRRPEIAAAVAKGLDISEQQATEAIDAEYTPDREVTQPRDGHVDLDALTQSARSLQSVGQLPADADIAQLIERSVDPGYATEAANSL